MKIDDLFIKEENKLLSEDLNKNSTDIELFEDASEAIKSLLSFNQSLKKDMKKSQSEDLGSSVKDLINKSLKFRK